MVSGLPYLAFLIVVAIQAAVIIALLVQRTRHARTERALRENEERFRLIADRAPVMMWTARPDTTFDFLNTTCVEFTGLSLDRMLDEGWLSAVHPDDVDHCQNTYVPAFEARTPFRMEYRVRGADSVYRWVLDIGVPKLGPDGTFAGYIGCTIDITDRKRAEEALRTSHRELQDLAGRLIEAQDAERARVARDLHDDVSQQLAGLAIAFSGLKHRVGELPGSEGLGGDLGSLHQRISALADSVRNLSHDLHPSVLQHVGLVAALTSYCAGVQRPHGIAVSCSAEGDLESISPEAALCLYRIAQEALHNVVEHADARKAHVHLRRDGDTAGIVVTDDGKGFDVEDVKATGKGLGLVSITERVRLAGGTVAIETAPQKGTRLRAEIPAINVASAAVG